ncbi:MAG TPA: HlyD family efflux transporter periplasmic adaptor subunit [Anaerolineales bacterium]|nr:HlyD family efflux transporter periplasmic adaptor subunit [Anaerolineales bacterium]
MKSQLVRSAWTILAILALAGCQAGATPTPTPSAETEPVVPILSATGQVVPETRANLSLPTGGIVEAISFEEGEAVKKGQTILQLSGREQLEALVASAGLEALAAQLALDEVIEQAGVVRAQVQSDLAYAREDLRAAQYKWSVQQEGNRANSDTIRTARARVTLAEDEVDRAKRDYDRAPGRSDDPAKAAALAEWMAAKKAYDAAVRALNWYTGKPTEIQQGMLDADVALAEAKVAAAELAWQDVQDGPDPDTLAQAEARLASAQANLRAAEKALADAELTAPFDGVLAAINVRPNEWILPGQVVVVLADLTSFEVETTDLNEIDAARVDEGALANVTFDALPDVQVEARVVSVAPKAAEGSGVNYTVILSLTEIPPRLRWGMTAFVDILVGEPSVAEGG